MAMTGEDYGKFVKHYDLLHGPKYIDGDQADMIYDMFSGKDSTYFKQKEADKVYLDFSAWIASFSRIAKLNQLNAKAAPKSAQSWRSVVDVITAAANQHVKSVTFEYILLDAFTGNMDGSRDINITSKFGYTGEQKTSSHTMAKVEAGMEYSSDFSPVSGHVDVSAQVDFSSAFEASQNSETTTTTASHIDFSKPCYGYQKAIRIDYDDGTNQTIYAGHFISSYEMGFSHTVSGCALFK